MSTYSLRASSHARLRLLQRAGVETGSVIDAWRNGTPVTIDYRDYHNATYNDALEVILLEHGGVITTVLTAAFEKFMEEER